MYEHDLSCTWTYNQLVRLRYNFRIYPTVGQQQSLARALGCARVVFNDALRARKEAHAAGQPYLSDGELSKVVITQAKKTVERAWLGEVSSVVLQQALADLNATPASRSRRAESCGFRRSATCGCGGRGSCRRNRRQ